MSDMSVNGHNGHNGHTLVSVFFERIFGIPRTSAELDKSGVMQQ